MINPLFSTCLKYLTGRCMLLLCYILGKTYPRLFLEEESASEIQEVMRKYEAGIVIVVIKILGVTSVLDQSSPGMIASVFLYYLKLLPCSLIDFDYCTTKSRII